MLVCERWDSNEECAALAQMCGEEEDPVVAEASGHDRQSLPTGVGLSVGSSL